MVSQNVIACLLIVTGIGMLAIVNELGWLVLMVPVALLVARSFMTRDAQETAWRAPLKRDSL